MTTPVEVSVAPQSDLLGLLIDSRVQLTSELSGSFYDRLKEVEQKGDRLHEVGVLEQYVFKYMGKEDLKKAMMVCRHWALTCHLNQELLQRLYHLDVVESWPDEWKEVWRTCFVSHDAEKLLQGVVQVRKWLSIERNPPIEEAVKENLILRKLIELLAHPVTTIRFEACWAVTNVCSGASHFTEAAVKEGVIGAVMAHILTSDDVSVVEQGVWCIGNIAGDSPSLRDKVIGAGVIDAFLALVGRFSSATFLRNYAWAVSNLCRGKPAPSFDAVSRLLPAITSLLTSQDNEVLTDALWACSYLSDGPNDRIAAVLDSGILPVVIEKIHCPPLTIPALRTLGNIVTGDDRQTQLAIDGGALEGLAALLPHPKTTVRKEACWALSNIAGGTDTQVQALLESGCIPRIVSMSINDERDVRKEALWTISNCTNVATLCKKLVEEGGISSLTANIVEPLDTKVASVALEGLKNVVRAMEESIADTLQCDPHYEDLLAILRDNAAGGSSNPIASESEEILELLGLTTEE